ncbi:MAG: hypothetical protein IBX57_00865 [Gammaproteobacteria bacterium]|nr:hypothetical protein [Gammaproteobacteria bacterium]
MFDNEERNIDDLGQGTYLAQFNKANGVFTTIIDDVEDLELLNHDLFYYKRVVINPSTQVVLGNYVNFNVVNIQDLPTSITEEQVDVLAREKIVSVYPIEKQLNILSGAIISLSEKLGVEIPEIKEMQSFIEEVLRINKIRKMSYMDNPDYDYKTEDDVRLEFYLKHEGGILEYEE